MTHLRELKNTIVLQNTNKQKKNHKVYKIIEVLN